MKYETKLLPNGIKFMIRRGNKKIADEYVINEVWNSKCYNISGFCIKESDTVIDIGAHIGCFTVYAADIAKKGKIYSYEPFPENYALLKENIKINELKNVKIFNLGISSKSEKRKLYLHKTDAGSHSMFAVKNNYSLFNCIPLKDVFDNNKIKFCNFLKIDCEGAEYEIILNTPKEYFDRVDKIVLEYHDYLFEEPNLTRLKRQLKKYGFKIKINPIRKNWGLLYAKKKYKTRNLLSYFFSLRHRGHLAEKNSPFCLVMCLPAVK